ncbi:uncharacterized protein LOC135079754 isoform X2 [Ostrinia nubilalis]|uniref:uncharacterized protein LOC135079754 isoform X2 n=1 Tax=Ostrinia nubilalis TaxID=29057 RepID=UPI0030824A4C
MKKNSRVYSKATLILSFNKKTTKVFRGVDAIRMAEVAKKEIYYFKMELGGACFDRPMYELDEPTPDEMEWITTRKAEIKLDTVNAHARREARQASRKKHRAELMVPHLQHLNFVLYWPHTTHAHFELYERWDLNTLVRKILYEEIPQIDNEKLLSDQPPRKTAFDRYKSYSLSKEEILQLRREEKIKRQEEELMKRARRLSEMQRLARQAQDDAVEAKRLEKEQRKLQLLKAGNLNALDQIDEEPEDEIDIVIPEELPEEIEEESEEENDDEYFPPAGLLVPGLYAPPNDIAKANGLAILFPRLVMECVTPQPEFLPPHVLVMLAIGQRYTAVEAMQRHKNAIIHMGIFKATTPFDAKHVAYSVKQYDQLDMAVNESELRIAFMVSIKIDLPLLELMDLNPLYVSRDSISGEEECAAMFPVGYADEYPEFEDFGNLTIRKTTEDVNSRI